MAKRHERTYARKQAIQVLYQAEILDTTASSLLGNEASFIDGSRPSQYAARLIGGIEERLAPIDALLEEYSENWTVDRMPTVDRAILRLACYEMAYVKEVPVSVAINEAVDLAKEYGGEDESHRFVNGVLGRIAEYLEEHKGEMPQVEAEPKAAEAEEAEEAEGEDAVEDETESAPEAEAQAEPETAPAPKAEEAPAPEPSKEGDR